MNKEQFHHIYQTQIRLTRHLNSTLKHDWSMDKHTIELNRLNSFDQIEDSLSKIDLNLYTIFPFDTADYSSYILFHRAFSHELSLISINLTDEDLSPNDSPSIIEKFCCYKVTEMIADFYKSLNIDVSLSKDSTTINLNQLSDFSSEILVSNISLINGKSTCGNFYIIFPISLIEGPK